MTLSYSPLCQETFQDPNAIDIDSEDFKALPAEIQHELIKEIRAERKWMSTDYLSKVWNSVIRFSTGKHHGYISVSVYTLRSSLFKFI